MADLLATDLAVDQRFTLEVIPSRGAVLYIERILPNSLEEVTILEQRICRRP